jgi:D-glycero-beta-D-manno-heptose 1-phosphate adenylyltransferase
MTRLEFIESKILNMEKMMLKRALFEFKKEEVVFTNGCFDILHLGHVTYLAKAAQLGKRLIIGLNSDESVRRLNKGSNRPIHTELDRALVLAALGFVDGLIVFDEPTPEQLIAQLKPDILVKGGDYDQYELDKNNKKYIVGSDLVRSYGGLVTTIPLIEGFSTTGIIQKLEND